MKSKLASSDRFLPYTVEYARTLKTMIEARQMAQKETSCSRLATLNQPRKRLMFSSSWRTIEPVDGAGSGSPVSGDSIFGIYAPIPKPFSLIHLDCTRLFAPPAPAKTRPASSVATFTSPVGSLPALSRLSLSPLHADALIA